VHAKRSICSLRRFINWRSPIFIRDGHFARHVRRMRRVYQSRRDALLAGLARHCTPHLTVHNADAGLHVAAMLAPGLDDRAVVLRIRDRALTATALSSSYAERAKRSGLLLGFGGSTERRITDATRMLGEVLRTAVIEDGSRSTLRDRFGVVCR
jgi:GntR family transcriptional regulator/MocR family aminotransferase